MIFEQIKIGGDRNFGYLVGDKQAGKGMLVDPAYGEEMVLSLVKDYGLDIVYIVNTHGHADHSQLSAHMAVKTGGKVVCHSSSAGPNDIAVEDGDELEIGSLKVKIIHTPGHTQDSICLLAGGNLITGDTLFVGKVGGTDLGDQAQAEYDSLFNKLLKLPDEVQVWPGHDYGVKPTSTIGHERRTNPFLLRTSVDDFVDLKRNWAQYKQEHGIK